MENERTGFRDVDTFGGGHADFGALLAGAGTTIGVGLMLLALGVAVGFSAFDPTEAFATRDALFGGGGWSLVAIVASTLVGGVLTTTLAPRMPQSAAVAHGIAQWALAFVAAMAFTTAIGAGAAPGATAAAPIDLPSFEAFDDPAAQAQLQAEAEGTAQGAADAGAWASWGFFATALLAMIAGGVGGAWGNPTERGVDNRRVLTPGMRPVDV
jgi:hypothetical protein